MLGISGYGAMVELINIHQPCSPCICVEKNGQPSVIREPLTVTLDINSQHLQLSTLAVAQWLACCTGNIVKVATVGSPSPG